jgi:hypothetical protein
VESDHCTPHETSIFRAAQYVRVEDAVKAEERKIENFNNNQKRRNRKLEKIDNEVELFILDF